MTRHPGRPSKPAGRATKPIPMTLFMVGCHEVRIWIDGDRWTVAVDGLLLPRWFPTQAEAWTAAVGEADRADRAGAS